MRLEKIKLAGFKSFVDPTTVLLPRNLTGIVGPNGCGKSNIIDAVRWVMGESSAKTLRGDSMADVIFNGSASRKPVGQASIELIFDNSDGRAGGQYAQYGEVSVKRQVSRDGQSHYYLNGVRCRRRDIMDLFLGTGLGPRSYAIIEQGMISRFIEAKPDDLRLFIEEAAGVSKYKERRRETENRMRHTRENLERLNDLRDEIGKQLKHLQRQAKTAERYQALRQEERQLRAELLALRWRLLDEESNVRSRRMQERETAVQASRAEQRSIETEIERIREGHAEAGDEFNRIQGVFYARGGEIGHIEQAIQHANELRGQQQQDLEQVEQGLEEARCHLETDHKRLEELAQALVEDEPLLEEARVVEQTTLARLAEAEVLLNEWQSEWDRFTERAAEPRQTAQVERTRINHLEPHVEQMHVRIARLEQEKARLSDPRLEQEIALLEQQEQEGEETRERRQEVLSEVQAQIAGLREETRRWGAELDSVQHRLQRLEGRRSSLEALQEAALGKGDGAVSAWLDVQGLRGAQRLAEALEVEPGWERAVETVLSFHLEAVCVEGMDRLGAGVQEIPEGTLTLFDIGSTAVIEPRPDSGAPLRSKVNSPWCLEPLLGSVVAAESLAQAWQLRPNLAPHESVISPEAVWLGSNWLRLARASDAGAGVLLREQEMRQLAQDIEAVAEQADALRERIEADRRNLQEQEERRDRIQAELNQAARELTELKTRLSAKRARLEQMQSRRMQLADEVNELTRQIETEQAQILAARSRLHQALEGMETLAAERDTLTRRREDLRANIEHARTEAGADRDRLHEIALRVERMRSTRVSTQQALARAQEQMAQLEQRRRELLASVQAGEAPLQALGEELEERLAERLDVEAELSEARDRLEAMDTTLRALEQKRRATEQALQEVREALEGLRIEQQETLIRRQTAQEQLEQSGFEHLVLLESLPEEVSEAAWEQRLQDVVGQIERLGPINLAAIEEFAALSERMAYLDAQHEDISESLATLEQAIHKIDRETRARFKETFDQVNAGFQGMFPRLFGGGQAFLELTGNDLLDAGISVMARPPGKRNSTIHLLSGGEKALTAISLVFAIFELNPAPFCLLDEVDAPLDDANVGRFCELLVAMSERVQLIFITHNKMTMEMSHHLSGVTMQEPGVSRLVSVDVDEAVQMAAL